MTYGARGARTVKASGRTSSETTFRCAASAFVSAVGEVPWSLLQAARSAPTHVTDSVLRIALPCMMHLRLRVVCSDAADLENAVIQLQLIAARQPHQVNAMHEAQIRPAVRRAVDDGSLVLELLGSARPAAIL